MGQHINRLRHVVVDLAGLLPLDLLGQVQAISIQSPRGSASGWAMTTTSNDTTAPRRGDPVSPVTAPTTQTGSRTELGGDEARDLTLGEVAALVGVTTVAAVAIWSLALAQAGHHEGWVALALGLVTTGILAGAARAMGGRRRMKVDLVEIGLLAAVVVAGLFFFLPGFHYAWVDKDPGVYVAHGFAIAREGDAYIHDPVTERDIEPTLSTGGRFPGFWIEADRPNSITVQFYHLFSSSLATAHDLGGARALFNLNPILAVGSVCVLVVAARRAAGTVAAALAGGLLVTSMIQVWQARYPSTEILSQLLLSGALLAAVLALDRRWAGGAFLAGVFLGTGFLARPDGFLYIWLAAIAVGLVVALDKVDRRVWALAGGLALTLPYALWNAYEVRNTYTRANHIPGPEIVVGAVVLAVVAGYAARLMLAALARRYPDALVWRPVEAIRRWRLPIGAGVCVLALAVLLVYFYREDLFGIGYRYYPISDSVSRSYDELTLQWFSWFTTQRGLLLMWLGICVLMLRRWRASLFALVTPGALLLFLYLWDARVNMRLMWFVRRFAPAVLPAVALLIALALAFALTRRPILVKVAGAALAVSLLFEWADMSLDLRDHDEMAGSWDMAAAIAAKAGDEQGVFLFPPGNNLYSINRNAPGSVWFIFDQDAARIPRDYDVTTVDEYQEAFPDRPIFLVTHGEDFPDQLPRDRFVDTGTVTGELVFWEETRDHRPDEQVVMPMGVNVWRYEAA